MTVNAGTRILDRIQPRLLENAVRAIQEKIEAHPDEVFYGAAFRMLYADGTVVGPPVLALNTESSIREVPEEDGCVWTSRWAPSEWRWDVVDAFHEAVAADYQDLSAAYETLTDEDQHALEQRNGEVVGAAAKQITVSLRELRVGWFPERIAEGFLLVTLCDDQSEEEFRDLLRLSVAPEDHALLGEYERTLLAA